MKIVKVCAAGDAVMVVPETVAECGAMHWLADRFFNTDVRFVYDTTEYDGSAQHPMLWLHGQVDEVKKP